MSFRDFFFKFRSYTPIPLIIAALVRLEPASPLAGGLIIALIGESIRLWSVRLPAALRARPERSVRMFWSPTGPYGHLRNPLYLGPTFCSASGFLIMAWPWMPWLMLIFLLLFFIQYKPSQPGRGFSAQKVRRAVSGVRTECTLHASPFSPPGARASAHRPR